MENPCPVTFVTAGFGLEFYSNRVTLNHFHRLCLVDRGTPPLDRRSGRATAIEGNDAMRHVSPGIWTCAALYVAIGLIGIFVLTSGAGVTTTSEGYGIAAIAAPASAR
jgi:hypothetical protein